MTNQLPVLLPVREVAQALRVERTTVHRMITTGELPAIRVGHGRGVYRVPEDAVTAYLARRTTTQTA